LLKITIAYQKLQKKNTAVSILGWGSYQGDLQPALGYPNSEKVRVHEQQSQGGGLVWVHSELVRAGKVTPADCFLVSRSQRVEGIPKSINFAREIWEGGTHPTYADVLKRFPMVEGGWWVWQEDKPIAPRDHQNQRGRG
jgi:hypothetical protein